MRYLIDNNLAPCNWFELDANLEENAYGYRVNKVYCAQSQPKQIDQPNVPDLRIVSFSMVCYSREGSPRPDRNPVLILSTTASNGETRQFTAGEDRDDKPVLEAFTTYIRQFDPDVIASYGANSTDWAYLRGRSHKLGLHLDFDRAKLEPHTSVYGHVSTTGVVNVDLADFTDMFPELKVKTLWNFADHLGVALDEQSMVEDVLYADYWDDPKKRMALQRFGGDSAKKV